MVLDPFSALGLASNIVQFVDFSSKLISESYGLYKSAGSSAETTELKTITSDLNQLSVKLQELSHTSLNPPGSSDEKALRDPAASCNGVAAELLTILRDLEVESPHQKWQSFRQALKTVMRKENIEGLEHRIDLFRQQIIVRLVDILSDRQSSVLTELQSLVKENRKMDINRTDQLAQLSKSLDLVRSSTSIAANKADLKDISSKLDPIASMGESLALEQKILDSLRFKTMKVRHENIAKAHADTFHWIFHSQSQQSQTSSCPNFLQWLQRSYIQGGNIFRIAGKASSGKSTLMKFIYSHPSTQVALRKWAGKSKLVVASFFFWLSGTRMQKSQDGLLQSSLHEIL